LKISFTYYRREVKMEKTGLREWCIFIDSSNEKEKKMRKHISSKAVLALILAFACMASTGCSEKGQEADKGVSSRTSGAEPTLAAPDENESKTPAEKIIPAAKVEYQLNFAKGKSRYMDMTATTNYAEIFRGRQRNMKQSQTLGIIIDITEVNPDGSAWLNYSFDRVVVEVQDITGRIKYDSSIDAEKPQDPQLQIFAALSGQGLAVKMTPRGLVVEIKGLDEFFHTIFAKIDLSPEDKQQIKETFGGQIIKQMTEGALAILPDQPVTIGETWTQKAILTQSYPMAIENTYTLKDRKNGVAIINIAADIKTEEKATRQMLGAKVEYAFTGQKRGTIELDEKTGWIKSKTVTTNISEQAIVPGVSDPNSAVAGRHHIELTESITVREKN